MGDTYIVLQTTQNKGGAYLFDIHFWIGKDTSQVFIFGHDSIYYVLNLNRHYY
jgi:hypothetical protein